MEKLPDGNSNLVKVDIDLKDEVCGVESLWAEPAGDGLYRLRNVPFLAYGYSEQDVVQATDVDGHLIVNGVAGRSGHSTYRLFFPEATGNEKFRPLWEPFAKLGCTFERANSRLIGVNVPPDTDVYAVYAVLEKGEQAKHWTFEEGHCGHRLYAREDERAAGPTSGYSGPNGPW
jgi:hypothetical protein